MNGKVPYRCAYQAAEPTAARVADARVARELRNDFASVSVRVRRFHNKKHVKHTWKADEGPEVVEANRTRCYCGL